MTCKPLVLLCDFRQVGNCVIVNHFDRPTSELVAVITSREGDEVRWKYLNSHHRLDSYAAGDGMVGPASEVAPLAHFGVEVFTDGSFYWCEKFRKVSEARYPGGGVREWQQDVSNQRHRARAELLKLCLSTTSKAWWSIW